MAYIMPIYMEDGRIKTLRVSNNPMANIMLIYLEGGLIKTARVSNKPQGFIS